MVNDANEEGIDPEVFLEKLMDSAKLLAEAQYNQTESRRACIIPLFQKNIRGVLKTNTADSFLFGKDLTSSIKQLKESETLFEQQAQKYPGNYKSPFERKPFSNLQGNTGTTSQGRQRLFFRGFRGRSQTRGRGQYTRYMNRPRGYQHNNSNK